MHVICNTILSILVISWDFRMIVIRIISIFILYSHYVSTLFKVSFCKVEKFYLNGFSLGLIDHCKQTNNLHVTLNMSRAHTSDLLQRC